MPSLVRDLILLAPTLLDPRGRCNRKGLLAVATLLLAIELMALLAFWGFGWSLTGPGAFGLKLLFCWLAIAGCAKRLHDLGRRAWWMALAVPATILWSLAVALAFAFGLGLESLTPQSSWYMVAVGASMLPVVLAMLWLHCARGTAGANRFGPEPAGLGFSEPARRRTTAAAHAQPA
jgi:uncharacterized membrane protein YhaH (DUF805 family)